ncbi:MAG: GrpB family protein [Thermoplasmataceae archaeon]
MVVDINRVDNFIGDMESLGYTSMREFGIPGRRYFYKGQEEHTHHVHIFEDGNEHIERHIAFRDYLRGHPEVAKRYGGLKIKLVNRYPEDVDSYQEGKNSTIREIHAEAIRWYRESFRLGTLQ